MHAAFLVYQGSAPGSGCHVAALTLRLRHDKHACTTCCLFAGRPVESDRTNFFISLQHVGREASDVARGRSGAWTRAAKTDTAEGVAATSCPSGTDRRAARGLRGETGMMDGSRIGGGLSQSSYSASSLNNLRSASCRRSGTAAAPLRHRCHIERTMEWWL